ncbi:MAG: amino acid ABC transporter permease [Eggerthellaceae bacterium]|nr:amino acid ABC transporter permease [Eggerthellaceae bacterium]
MLEKTLPSHSLASRMFGLLLACLLALCALVALPVDCAFAMTTEKCSAKPNTEVGSDVQGATNTRVTWEGQSDADEQVAAVTLTFPEGTEFGLDNARVTMLTGDDLMTRTVIDAEMTAEGQTFRAVFPEPAQAGGYFRIEVYGVKFPAEGGDMQMAGTYVLADGSEMAIEDMRAIPVVGVTLAEQISNYLSEQEWVQQWNSNKFLRLFFNPMVLVTSFPVVLHGFVMALGIVAVAFPLAIPIGLLLALMRMSKLGILRGLASLYVNVVRGTPLFLQIYIAFFGLPLAGIQVPPFPLGVIVLAMNSSAYLCEIFRAGIQSIPKGQFEASRSLGMNGAQTMIFVIIPQTVRRVIPTMTSEFILLYKDTSLLAAVGVMEVVMYAKTIVANTGSITPYIVAAFFYLVITLPLAKLVGNLENKLAGNDAGKSKKKRKKKAAANAKAVSSGTEGATGLAGAADSAFVEHGAGVESSGAGFGGESFVRQERPVGVPDDAFDKRITPAQHGSM